MWKNLSVSLLLSIALLCGPVSASEQAGSGDEAGQIKSTIHNILANNSAFMKKHGASYFKTFADSQRPKITLITCSDSRVQSHLLSTKPDNEIFTIRNIGNQIVTAEGSVEYGIDHLHTPVLLILGHVRCGAVKAASGDYSQETPAVKRELDSLRITKGGDSLENVRTNVNNQVATAMAKFAKDVGKGRLVVIGAVYDFADDLHQGYGKLTIINVNGDSSPDKIEALISEHGTKGTKKKKK